MSTGRTRSVTEAMERLLAGLKIFHHAVIQRSKAVADHLLGQFAADEDETALARLARFPGALVIALQHHVHALKDIAIVIVAEGQNAFRAQDLLALARDQVLQPRHELGRVERLVRAQRQRLHVLVMIVLQAVWP